MKDGFSLVPRKTGWLMTELASIADSHGFDTESITPELMVASWRGDRGMDMIDEFSHLMRCYFIKPKDIEYAEVVFNSQTIPMSEVLSRLTESGVGSVLVKIDRDLLLKEAEKS
jgi:hypothetical protein